MKSFFVNLKRSVIKSTKKFIRTTLSYYWGPQYNSESMDPLVYQKGTGVAVVIASRAELEGICTLMRNHFGNKLRIDWHFVGGRGVIRTVGEINKTVAQSWLVNHRITENYQVLLV